MADDNVASFVDVVNKLSLLDRFDEAFEELTVTFRKLRNDCAKGSRVQNEIASDENILASTLKILSYIIKTDRNSNSDPASLCLTVGLQFVANLLVNNYEVQERVWETYENFLGDCLSFNNPKIQNCAVMIMYNIFLGHPDYMFFENNTFEDVLTLTTNGSSSEFPIFLIQLLISKTNYVQQIYKKLKPESKLILMEIIQDYLKNDDIYLSKDLVNFFIRKFLVYSNDILYVLEKCESPFKAQECVKILELLTSISSCHESSLLMLQTEKSLLSNCIMLLRNVHSLSKESDNSFSMINKLSDLNKIEKNTAVQEHPYFGFKSSLIRLIGNLCWKSKENQDKVCELECIPVILDCCNIDGRNPFIIQWCILAIRNICDGNIENQKYIAAMSKIGGIDVDKLEKMGLMLNKESDGSMLSISPLEIKK